MGRSVVCAFEQHMNMQIMSGPRPIACVHTYMHACSMHGASASGNSVAVGHAWPHGQSWKLCMHACSLVNVQYYSGLLKWNVQTKTKKVFIPRTRAFIVVKLSARENMHGSPPMRVCFPFLYYQRKEMAVVWYPGIWWSCMWHVPCMSSSGIW